MFLRQFILLVTCFVLAACGGAPSGGGASGKTPSVKSSSEQRPGGPYIYATIAFEKLPVKLPVNSENLSDNFVEYQFEVYFDVDGDQVLSRGDVFFQLQHVKRPTAKFDQMALTEFDRMVAVIKEVDEFSHPSAYSFSKSFDVTVDNNALTFKVSQSLFRELTRINQYTQIHVRVDSHGFGVSGYDTLPTGTSSFDVIYTQEMSNRYIPDYLDDYIVWLGQDSLDIESVSIRFD